MRATAAVLALVVGLPACGGGGHDTPHSDVASGRVVTMSVTDALRFDPSAVDAKPGEKIRFRIANAGKLAHEFVLGDAAFQQKHRDQMATASADHGVGHAEGSVAVDLPPGKTVDIDVTMPTTVPTFACYVDRHADAGMVGTVRYPR